MFGPYLPFVARADAALYLPVDLSPEVGSSAAGSGKVNAMLCPTMETAAPLGLMHHYLPPTLVSALTITLAFEHLQRNGRDAT